jgi:hypothetical protein
MPGAPQPNSYPPVLDRAILHRRFIDNLPSFVAQAQGLVDRLDTNAVMTAVCVMGVGEDGELGAAAHAYAGVDIPYMQAHSLYDALERAQSQGLKNLFGMVALNPADPTLFKDSGGLMAYPAHPSRRIVNMLTRASRSWNGEQPLVDPDDVAIVSAGLGVDNHLYRAYTLDELRMAYDNPDLPEAEELFSQVPVCDPGFRSIPLRGALLTHLVTEETPGEHPDFGILSVARIACGALTLPLSSHEG